MRTADVMSLDLVGEGAGEVPSTSATWPGRPPRLADHVGRAPNVAITIDKAIPVAGGWPAGSADAAAVLVAINALWEQGVRGRTCTRWPPSWAATCRSPCTAAPRWAPAAGGADHGAGAQHLPLGARVRVRRAVDREGVRRDRRARAVGNPPRLAEVEPVLRALAAGDAAELAPLLETSCRPPP